MLSPESPVKFLPTVGPQTVKKLRTLGIESIQDLLTYWPMRYDDFRTVTQIKDLEPGMNVSVSGRVSVIDNRKSWKKKITITQAIVEDDTGEIQVIWFNQPYLTKNIKPGDQISLAGKVQGKTKIDMQMVSPTYEKRSIENSIHTGRMVPVYSTTSGLTQKQLRFVIHQALRFKDRLDDQLPLNVRKQENLLDYALALQTIHFPEDNNLLAKALERLKFEELYHYFYQAAHLRKQIEKKKSLAIVFDKDAAQQFVESLPFQLTNAQKKVSWAVIQDLERSFPMQRIVQGDVGSGKTVVAAMAMHQLAINKAQAVMLAPTEILAQQHYQTIKKLLEPLNVHCGLLTRSQVEMSWVDKPTNSLFQKQLADGTLSVVVGTHSLIQDKIKYNQLALVVVDEQHRFGVAQREQLEKKSKLVPHMLSMSATPIPRSLAQTLFGDMDISVIDEMPAGRKPVSTSLVTKDNRSQTISHIKSLLKEGQQAYVICALIDPSDRLGVQAASEHFKSLQAKELKGYNIGLLHGRMAAKEKEATMSQFKKGELDVLVSTTVVEVGVDVPNATVILIEDADRFGLAQLHQLRGRVGRGEQQSFCYLATNSRDPKSLERLNALVQHSSGFALAQKDLALRGPGDRFGLRQSGAPEFKLADLGDWELMQRARSAVIGKTTN